VPCDVHLFLVAHTLNFVCGQMKETIGDNSIANYWLSRWERKRKRKGETERERNGANSTRFI